MANPQSGERAYKGRRHGNACAGSVLRHRTFGNMDMYVFGFVEILVDSVFVRVSSCVGYGDVRGFLHNVAESSRQFYLSRAFDCKNFDFEHISADFRVSKTVCYAYKVGGEQGVVYEFLRSEQSFDVALVNGNSLHAVLYDGFRALTTYRAYLSFKIADAGFSRVAGDYLVYGVVGQLEHTSVKSVTLQLLREEVVLCYGELFRGGVCVKLYHFHTVKEGARYCVEGVCGRDEQAVGEVNGKLDEVVAECLVLLSVEYLKKLCDEGLLAKESFTYSNTDLLAVAGTDEDVVGVMTNSSLAFMGAGDDPYRLRYICIAPLTGPDGVKYTAYSQSATNSQWHVTTYAENPELCFRVGDAQFTEEFFLAGRFGVENENWMTSENYLKANPGEEIAARYEAMGYEGHYVFYNDVRGTPNNLNWYDPMPYFSGTVECEGAYVSKAADGTTMSAENNCTVRQETASGVYQLCKPGSDVYVPNLAFTDEELEEISESLSTIKAYVNEQRTNYIIGEESDLADSQKFIDNLKSSFNLDKILEIADAAYQRQYAAK